MKNTLLTLMLVSSLFVISCGADSTKPTDAYKNQTTEIETGTKIAYNATVDNSTTPGTAIVDVSTFASAGEKVTEIVQVTTTTTGTTTTNTVTGITKNTDGGIYQFTISDNTATSATVTYKYSKKAALPMIEKEIIHTYNGSSSLITLNIREFYFDPNVLSVTDKNGKQLIENTDYSFSSTYGTVTIIKTTGYINGDTFTVRYAYRNMDTISGEPLKGDVTATSPTANQNATIQLNAATYAGRSYYVKANLTGTGTTSATTEILYANGIINSAGAATITGKYLTAINSGTYELWVY